MTLTLQVRRRPTTTISTAITASTNTATTSTTSTATTTATTSKTKTATTATSTATDPCAAKDCGNGSCNKGACVCSAGWGGADCKNNIDECAGNDCGNGGCKDLVDGFECECNAGWYGAGCKFSTTATSTTPVVDVKISATLSAGNKLNVGGDAAGSSDSAAAAVATNSTGAQVCNGVGDPLDCQAEYAGKCSNDLIGTLVQERCRVMCDTCKATTTTVSPSLAGIVGGSLAAIVIIAMLVAAFFWCRNIRHATADPNLEAGKNTQRGRPAVTAYKNPGFDDHTNAGDGNTNNTYDMGVPGVKTKRTKQGRSATMDGGSRSSPASNNVYDVGVRQGRSASTSNGGGSARASTYDHIGEASSTYSTLDESVYAHTSHSNGDGLVNAGSQLYNTLSRGKETAVAKHPAQTTTKKTKKKKQTKKKQTKTAAPFDDADAAAEVGQRSNNVYDVGVRSTMQVAATETNFDGFGGEYETIAPPPAHNNVYDVGVPLTKSSKAANAMLTFDADNSSDSSEIDI